MYSKFSRESKAQKQEATDMTVEKRKRNQNKKKGGGG